MKPRIRLHRSRAGEPFWVCIDPGIYPNGVGDTPVQAYRDWKGTRKKRKKGGL